MNERLKELYRQAHSVRHYDGHPSLDGNPPTVYWQGEVSAGRFAELIVKECISLMNHEQEYYSKSASYGSNEYYERCRSKEDAFEDAARIIKTNFGVEE